MYCNQNKENSWTFSTLEVLPISQTQNSQLAQLKGGFHSACQVMLFQWKHCSSHFPALVHTLCPSPASAKARRRLKNKIKVILLETGCRSFIGLIKRKIQLFILSNTPDQFSRALQLTVQGRVCTEAEKVGKFPLLPSSSSRDIMVSIRLTSESTGEHLSGCIPLHLSALWV